MIAFDAMSRKRGRNDPCPCGSGKKYKRCCLPMDEAAAHETTRQQALSADDEVFDESEFGEDDDAEEFYDVADSPLKEAPSTAVASFDLSGVLKQHRWQRGTCALCGKVVSRQSAQRHFVDCAPTHDARSGTAERLVHLRATSPGSPAYWLDVEAKADARLEALDSFLRNVWLECCGHLSVFRIGDVEYFSRGYELGVAPVFGFFGRNRSVERRMSTRLGGALPFAGESFSYEYDFGSTTSLQLKVMGERRGRLGRSPVRLLARNAPPVWPCAACSEPASLVCAYCCHSEGNPFVCAAHQRKHACGEDEGFLPVVNSPRMGVGGYTGES